MSSKYHKELKRVCPKLNEWRSLKKSKTEFRVRIDPPQADFR